jgi:hypothetical protein
MFSRTLLSLSHLSHLVLKDCLLLADRPRWTMLVGMLASPVVVWQKQPHLRQRVQHLVE